MHSVNIIEHQQTHHSTDSYQLGSGTIRALSESAALNSMDVWKLSAPHAFKCFQAEVLIDAIALRSMKAHQSFCLIGILTTDCIAVHISSTGKASHFSQKYLLDKCTADILVHNLSCNTRGEVHDGTTVLVHTIRLEGSVFVRIFLLT